MDKAQILIDKLIDKDLTITTAESCTGGMIASRLIDIAGASSVVNECHVTYSNEAKIKYLNVARETINEHGVVSYEIALEMAKGASKLANADMALAVTGIAGPNGGTDEKPVGLVYISCFYDNHVRVDKMIFSGNRTSVRKQTTEYAINMALDMLEDK